MLKKYKNDNNKSKLNPYPSMARVILFIFLSQILIGCRNIKKMNHRKRVLSGFYKIQYELTSEILKNVIYDTNLVIVLDTFDKFSINNKCVLFEDTTGFWKLSDGNFESWNELHFKNSNNYIQFGEIGSDSIIAFLISGFNEGGLSGNNYLYFKKIK